MLDIWGEIFHYFYILLQSDLQKWKEVIIHGCKKESKEKEEIVGIPARAGANTN
jgi:hypothetical protein